MSADRLRSEVSPAVTAVVGMIVAVVSAVFGISAHGLAAPLDMGPVTSGQVLMVGAASAGVGAVTAAIARLRSPIITAALGLIAGQGAVHLVVSSGHTHATSGTLTASSHALGHHASDAAAVRAAMDSAALDPLASAAALMSPMMLAAHVAAIGAALLTIAVLAGALAWLSARSFLLPVTAHLVVVVSILAPHQAGAPLKQYLLSRGGTRAPPVAV